MRKLTLMVVPDGTKTIRQIQIPTPFIKLTAMFFFVLIALTSYLVLEYFKLKGLSEEYYSVVAENEGLKGEARLLLNNLEDVKRSLRRVQNYSEKLGEITKLQVKNVSQKTGIGPLSPAEYDIARKSSGKSSSTSYIPLGIDMEKLIFKPVFDRLDMLSREANDNAIELQRLLSNLSQQKSLLSSIPSISPANGWLASGFGYRISPFTNKRTWHNGLDIAAPIGTPIYAPADGVVIFSGYKSGFGKFIMIAHGYGIVTRYGHNAQNMVQAGQRIQRGDQIATIGMSGRTTGPHLHYEVVVNGKNGDPKKFILNLYH